MNAIQLGALRIEVGLAIALALAGCESQAGTDYKGEALLRLEGQVTLTMDTGGEPMSPALCYAPRLFLGSFFPRQEKTPLTAADFPSDAWSDFHDGTSVRYWSPRTSDYQLVDVESSGKFPAEFNIAVYEAPPDAALQPVFGGEPRIGRASVCAVRDGHRLDGAFPFFDKADHCSDGDGPCQHQFLWLQRDSKRSYIETYDCPQADIARADCKLTTEGDEQITREYVEGLLGLAPDVSVIYLDAPAPAGGYTAWLFGKADRGVSAGFHVFSGNINDNELGSTQCDGDAYLRATAMASEKYADKIMNDPVYGPIVSPEFADEASDFASRAFAEIRMKECKPPSVEELPVNAPITVTLSEQSTIFRPESFAKPMP
jgi:hypothetical protein